MNILFAIATGTMFGMGVFQLLRRDLIKSAMGFYILFTAINLLFLAVGAFNGNVPPVTPVPEHTQPSDPLVQALLLTAIVISFGSYAFLLALISVSSRRYETVDSDLVDKLQG
ncbi:MAG: sodium:proton antiporter [Chloroflexota bacterium]